VIFVPSRTTEQCVYATVELKHVATASLASKL